jgi:hypothetical protein
MDLYLLLFTMCWNNRNHAFSRVDFIKIPPELLSYSSRLLIEGIVAGVAGAL